MNPIKEITKETIEKLDENIKDIVIALNKIGFVTDMSCEGHIGVSYFQKPYPWVTLEELTTKKLKNKHIELERYHLYMKKLITDRYFQLAESKEILEPYYKAYELYRRKYTKCELDYNKQLNQSFHKLHKLVYSFNEINKPKFPIQLCERELTVLYNYRQYSLSESEILINLSEMQTSMKKFAEFILK